jgi:hypothetical protein
LSPTQLRFEQIPGIKSYVILFWRWLQVNSAPLPLVMKSR